MPCPEDCAKDVQQKNTHSQLTPTPSDEYHSSPSILPKRLLQSSLPTTGSIITLCFLLPYSPSSQKLAQNHPPSHAMTRRRCSILESSRSATTNNFPTSHLEELPRQNISLFRAQIPSHASQSPLRCNLPRHSLTNSHHVQPPASSSPAESYLRPHRRSKDYSRQGIPDP